MTNDVLYSHVEPLTWRDIELLPIYIAAALFAMWVIHGLPEEAFVLRSTGAKAMALIGLLGFHRLWAELAER